VIHKPLVSENLELIVFVGQELVESIMLEAVYAPGQNSVSVRRYSPEIA
jgi:hypothetical protein